MLKFVKHLSSKFTHQVSALPVQNAIALASGVLMGCAPAPVSAWFLAWIALAPLWLIVKLNAEGTGKKSVRLQVSLTLPPLLWGIGYHGLALFWITGLHPLTWMGIPWLASLAIACFCWVFITLWGAAIVVVWAAVMTALDWAWHQAPFRVFPNLFDRADTLEAQSPPSWLRILLGTALWCGLEALWSSGALWWTALAYTQSPHNLLILHLGQLSGTTAITGAIVAVNGMLAEIWMQQGERRKGWTYLLPIGLFLVLHLIGFGLYARPIAQLPTAALQIGIIQGNIPTRIKLYEEGVRRAVHAYVTGYHTLVDQGVELVLMPEGALPLIWTEASFERSPIYQAILDRGVAIMLGTFGTRESRMTQSLLAIAGNGKVIGRYNKVKLVPLGEYIPFQEVLGGMMGRLSPVDVSMVPGAQNQQFNTPLGRAIAGICYESAFPQLFRSQAAAGGEFILTASNNDPYSSTMMFQHHAQDVMRAIETDRWAASTTNTGYSGIVDPHGKTLWLSEVNTYQLHVDKIYRRQTQTLYVRWGDWLLPLLFVVGALSWVWESRWCDPNKFPAARQ
jgi:apolipoprotein N-acyltransferase